MKNMERTKQNEVQTGKTWDTAHGEAQVRQRFPVGAWNQGNSVTRFSMWRSEKMIKCEVATLYGQCGAVYAEASPCKAGIQQTFSVPMRWQELQQCVGCWASSQKWLTNSEKNDRSNWEDGGVWWHTHKQTCMWEWEKVKWTYLALSTNICRMSDKSVFHTYVLKTIIGRLLLAHSFVKS